MTDIWIDHTVELGGTELETGELNTTSGMRKHSFYSQWMPKQYVIIGTFGRVPQHTKKFQKYGGDLVKCLPCKHAELSLDL